MKKAKMEIVPVLITFYPEIDMVEQVGHYASDMFFKKRYVLHVLCIPWWSSHFTSTSICFSPVEVLITCPRLMQPPLYNLCFHIVSSRSNRTNWQNSWDRKGWSCLPSLLLPLFQNKLLNFSRTSYQNREEGLGILFWNGMEGVYTKNMSRYNRI